MKEEDLHSAYYQANREAWNQKTTVHLNTDMYGLNEFKEGNLSLCDVERQWAESRIRGKKVLHLQCHFGLDSLSLERLGAEVTAIDLSDEAIRQACSIRDELGLNTKFICCNIYDLPEHLDEEFDFIYSTYGTIGWLPDLKQWSAIVHRFLKKGGELYLAEFHPMIWTMDDSFQRFGHYSYFHCADPIVEDQKGTYADREAPIVTRLYSWNHHFGEVLGVLLEQGLILKRFHEFDYSPYECFPDMECVGPDQYVMSPWGRKLPYFYLLEMKKQE